MTESQKRYLALLAEYVQIDTGKFLDREFEADIKTLRRKFLEFTDIEEEAKFSVSEEWKSFLLKYKFNKAMSDFLLYFVEFGVIYPKLINSGIYVVSEADGTAEGRITPPEITHFIYQNERSEKELKIVIPAGVTQNQVKDFIQTYWKSFIAVKQELHRSSLDQPKGRVKGSHSALRARVIELDKAKVPHKEIADIINTEFPEKQYAYSDISQIVYLNKSKQSKSQK